MLSVVMLSVDMPSVVMLTVVMLSVVYAECHYVECRYAECRRANKKLFETASSTFSKNEQSLSLSGMAQKLLSYTHVQ
jgi:hypothetical protein